jgi:hypothetical protein
MWQPTVDTKSGNKAIPQYYRTTRNTSPHSVVGEYLSGVQTQARCAILLLPIIFIIGKFLGTSSPDMYIRSSHL